jgi:hypothetical protein
MIFEQGSGLLAGQWGTYKTFLALDLCASVMSGEPFAGKRVVRRGGILFIAPEGAFEIPIRLTGLVQGKLRPAMSCTEREPGLELDPDRLPIAWIDECPRLLDSSSLPVLTATARAAAERLEAEWGLPLALIVIDTIAAGARFDDENSASEAQKVVNAMNGLSRATGAFVLGVDHFGKIAETGTRGSSGKDAGVDVMLAALADRDLAGAISKTRLAVRKVRGAPTGYEIPYAPRVVEIASDPQGEPITTCVIDWQPNAGLSTTDVIVKERWPASLKLFKAAVSTALIEHGAQVRPFGAEGPEVCAVPNAKVRAEFMLAYPADGETEAKRAEAKKKAYGRGLKEARIRDLVASREIGGIDHIWFATHDA